MTASLLTADCRLLTADSLLLYRYPAARLTGAPQ